MTTPPARPTVSSHGAIDFAPRYRLARIVLLVFAVVTVLSGLWAGLVRLGWPWPLPQPQWLALHGPLMVCGFLGTVIGLERAVGTGKLWVYAGPLLTATGAMLALLGIAGWPAALLTTLGSLIVLAALIFIFRIQPALFTGVIALGGVAWVIGNALWLAAWPIPLVLPWWMAFLVLTIAGERLELSRFLRLTRWIQGLFAAAVALLLCASALSIFMYGPGMRLLGAAFVLLALWLLRYDIARRRLRAGRQARFIATTLLSGYCWLALAGIIALLYGGVTAGPQYDAMVHALFLGFVMTMIFAHAPIVFPAVLGIQLHYTPRYYLPVILLETSLVLRLLGDFLPWGPGRLWGGLLGALAILLFFITTLLSAKTRAS